MVPLKRYTPLIFLNYDRIFPPTGAENREGWEMGMCPFPSLKEKSKILSFSSAIPPVPHIITTKKVTPNSRYAQ